MRGKSSSGAVQNPVVPGTVHTHSGRKEPFPVNWSSPVTNLHVLNVKQTFRILI